MKQFIDRDTITQVQKQHKCGVYKALEIIAPWAGDYIRVCGGYHAFEYVTDAEPWRKQK